MTEKYNYSFDLKGGATGGGPKAAAPSPQAKVRMASQALAEGRFRAAELMFKMLATEGETRVQTRLNLGMAVLYQGRWWEGAMILHLALLSATSQEQGQIAAKLKKNLQAWADHVYKQGLASDRQDLLALVNALFPLPESGLKLAARWLGELTPLTRYDVARDMLAWLRDTDTSIAVDGEDIRQLGSALVDVAGGDRLIIQLAEALRLNTRTPAEYGEAWSHLAGLAVVVAGNRKHGVREVTGLLLDNALSNDMDAELQRNFIRSLLSGMFGFDYRDDAVEAYRNLLQQLYPDVVFSQPCVEAGPHFQLYAIEKADSLISECMEGDLDGLFVDGHLDPDHALANLLGRISSVSFTRASRDPSLAGKRKFEQAVMPRLADAIHERAQQRSLAPLPKPSPRSAEAPLRVGYLTRHAHTHVIGLLMRNFLPYHSKDVEVYVYDAANMQRQDEVWRKIAAAAKQVRWGRVIDLSSARQLAEVIRGDDIDLLVDLDGGTELDLALLHYFRPARASAVVLGWDGPGLPYVDCYLSDPHGLADNAQDYYVERVERVRDCAFLGAGLETPADAAVREAARRQIGIEPQQIAYLVAAPGRKISAEVADDTLSILEGVPGAVLLVKGKGNASYMRRFWQGRAESRGLDASRIINLPYTETMEQHHAQLQAADVVLDTYPATGGVHSMENLWFGNPIVTRVGETFPSRITNSMLMSLKMTETVAADREDYVRIGVRLGTDEAFRLGLRNRLVQSVQERLGMWDLKTVVQDLEVAYRRILDGV